MLHKRTENECARIVFEQSILAALAMDPDISIIVKFHDQCVPEYLLQAMREHIHDLQLDYRLAMRSRLLSKVGVPHTVADAIAAHIEHERESVISFFNEIGDPVAVEA
jgi:hypothetical protein